MIAARRPTLTYSGHAAAGRDVLVRRRHRPGGEGSKRTRRSDDKGGWTLAGVLVGAALVAALSVAAVTSREVTAGGSLLSAVPTDAAFESAVARASRLLAPYEPATKAPETGDPEDWADDYVASAVLPATAELTSVTPPVHLREPVESVLRSLRGVVDELDAFRACAATGRECRTQRHALARAVDDVYRTTGDLELFTFG